LKLATIAATISTDSEFELLLPAASFSPADPALSCLRFFNLELSNLELSNLELSNLELRLPL